MTVRTPRPAPEIRGDWTSGGPNPMTLSVAKDRYRFADAAGGWVAKGVLGRDTDAGLYTWRYQCGVPRLTRAGQQAAGFAFGPQLNHEWDGTLTARYFRNPQNTDSPLVTVRLHRPPAGAWPRTLPALHLVWPYLPAAGDPITIGDSTLTLTLTVENSVRLVSPRGKIEFRPDGSALVTPTIISRRK